MLSEISHIEKDKYCMIPLTCGIQKTKQMNNNKTQTDSQMQETNWWWPERRWGGGMSEISEGDSEQLSGK